ncbi:Mandelate racemase/muconate lactonizing protein [Hallella multisaccharivorax DSM 17128]|uniref:Mandelate racemase/muconate lactonizing protein n=1 Tax=Hallella multisaccharivorax DSM 17128 TaxID=688246 RepID=F8N8I9_9BACT|nr:o-succinylbenzoate synthase [Hallella multisaccharivorax]EGN56556.1 Mandelate racemase/muconate lactonizing protein [Hallella multisaccharivorax DSM 17128]
MKTTISSRLLHFKQPAGTSRGMYTTHLSYYVTVEKDGVRGVGECSVLPDLSCDALPRERYEAVLRKACTWVERTGGIPYELLRPYPSILFGLETAFAQLDAGGSEALSQTPFARGEEGITINGLVWMGTFEEMAARLEEKLRKGFHCVKLKVGAIDFGHELDLVRYIRERFTCEQVELRVDANGGFAPDNALERLTALADYGIHSIEQPIRQRQWREMAQLCLRSPLPIALDEELIGVNQPEQKARLLDAIHPAFIVLKPSLHGGMRGCREWIRLARERGVGSWITSALESNVGLNAIAHLCAEVYGPHITMPQGLGTGQLYIDNVVMPLKIVRDQLWFLKNS